MEFKFGDIVVKERYWRNDKANVYIFLKYVGNSRLCEILFIPSSVFIPEKMDWKPDIDKLEDTYYVWKHKITLRNWELCYASEDHVFNHNKRVTECGMEEWFEKMLRIKKVRKETKTTIDEWLGSYGAKRDALKFKNGCYIISGPRSGKSYYKELINSVYGYDRKPPYDDMPDAVASAIKAYEIKQREERLEQAKLTSEELKKMLDNSRYGVCWPSELIESCERIDKYKEEETKDMSKTLICGKVELSADLYLKGRTPDYDKTIYANVFAYDDRSGLQINLKFCDGWAGRTFSIRMVDVDVCAAYFAGTALFTFIYNRIYDQTDGQIIINNTPINISRLRHIVEEYDIFKDRKEEVKEEYTYDPILTGRVIRQDGIDYVIGTYGFNETHYDDAKIVKRSLLAYKVPDGYTSDTFVPIVKRSGKEYLSTLTYERELYYHTFDDGRITVPCFVFVNKKKEEKKETTEMKGFKDLFTKGAFGSKIYIQVKDSDKVTYAGTMTNMKLETALGCELHGYIDFIADDEPVEKLANFNRGFIKKVVFHDPATIVEWKDGSKTVVQARDGEKFDPEKGLAMAISKKALGNKHDYYNVFKHYLKKVLEKPVKDMPDELYYDNNPISFKEFEENLDDGLVTIKLSAKDYKTLGKLLEKNNAYLEKGDK